MARLHLRTGALALARAELEALAGAARLDRPALLDLAEVRWRTGDLAGAAEAVDAYIGLGGGDPLAAVIAAEAAAAQGRAADAYRYSADALGRLRRPLDAVFAGLPRSAVWPGAGTSVPAAGGGPTLFGDDGPVAPSGRAVPSAGRATSADPAAAAPSGGGPASSVGSLPAREALARGRRELADGRPGTAALWLALALRLDPGLGPTILDLVEGESDPRLALVCGDAYRLVGREAEARRAFVAALRLASSAEPADRDGAPRPSGPADGSSP